MRTFWIYLYLCILISISFIQSEVLSSPLSPTEYEGHFLWGKSVGGKGNDGISATTRDDNGDVFMAGNFTATVEFDSNTIRTASGKSDLFLARYNSEGNLIWLQQAGGGEDIWASSIAKSDDAIYICGQANGKINFGEGVVLNGSYQSYIAKYDLSGKILWVKEIGKDMNPTISRIVVNKQGNIFIAGDIHDTVFFLGDSVSATKDYNDAYLASIDSAGKLNWIQQGGGIQSDNIVDLAVGNNNDVYITGHYRGIAQFSDKKTESALEGYFVTKYTDFGQVEWVQSGRFNENGWPQAIVVDRNNNVTVAGYFNGEVNFDNGQKFIGANNNGFIAQYSSTGSFRWAKHLYQNGGSMDVVALAADGFANIYAIGQKNDRDVVELGNGITISPVGEFYLAMYDSIGHAQWAINPNGKLIGRTKLLTDSINSIYITSCFDGTMVLDEKIALISRGGVDLFFAKYHKDTANNKPDTVATTEELAIIYPNGGETLVSGSNIDIQWGGIGIEDTISLFYSMDLGKNWILITDYATNLSYTWHVPDSVGTGYLLKAKPKIGSSLNFKPDWGMSIGDSVYDTMISTSMDAFGNIYVFGVFTGTIEFGNNIRLYSVHPQISNYCIAKFDKTGKALWAKILPPSDEGWRGNSYFDMTTDRKGNVFLGGYYYNGTDFGTGSRLSSNGEADAFLLKYSTSGEVQWVQRLEDPARYEHISSITTDEDNNIYVSGIFGEKIVLGRNQEITLTADYGSNSSFIAKYNENGDVQWAQVVKTTDFTSISDMTVDSQGDLLLCGIFKGTVIFDSVEISAVSISDDHNLFVVKYDPDGNIKWARGAEGAGSKSQESGNICTDPNGNIYIGGATDGVAEFGNNVRLTTQGKQDMFVVKYMSQGDAQWVRSIPNFYYDDAITSISFANDMIYAGGYLFHQGANSLYILQLDTLGNINWKDSLTQAGSSKGTSIVVDSSGSFFIGGEFTRTIDFDNGVRMNSTGERDMFLVRYENQTDLSDSTWSIVKPTLDYIVEIDMGKVNISESKDSIITGYIRNPNTFSVRVDSISLVGGHNQDFLILSSATPLTLQSNEDQEVTLRFAPTARGLRQTQLQVHLQGDTKDNISVRGEGVNYNLTLFPLRPMPTTGESDVEFELPEEMYIKLILTDLLGKQMFFTEGIYKAGRHFVRINTSIVSIGAYTITLQTPDTMLHQKIIIK